MVPSASPRKAKVTPSPRIIRRTCSRPAPKASRSPISRVRWAATKEPHKFRWQPTEEQKGQRGETSVQNRRKAVSGQPTFRDLGHGPNIGERQVGLYGGENIRDASGQRRRVTRGAHGHLGIVATDSARMARPSREHRHCVGRGCGRFEKHRRSATAHAAANPQRPGRVSP